MSRRTPAVNSSRANAQADRSTVGHGAARALLNDDSDDDDVLPQLQFGPVDRALFAAPVNNDAGEENDEENDGRQKRNRVASVSPPNGGGKQQQQGAPLNKVPMKLPLLKAELVKDLLQRVDYALELEKISVSALGDDKGETSHFVDLGPVSFKCLAPLIQLLPRSFAQVGADNRTLADSTWTPATLATLARIGCRHWWGGAKAWSSEVVQPELDGIAGTDLLLTVANFLCQGREWSREGNHDYNFWSAIEGTPVQKYLESQSTCPESCNLLHKHLVVLQLLSTKVQLEDRTAKGEVPKLPFELEWSEIELATEEDQEKASPSTDPTAGGEPTSSSPSSSVIVYPKAANVRLVIRSSCRQRLQTKLGVEVAMRRSLASGFALLGIDAPVAIVDDSIPHPSCTTDPEGELIESIYCKDKATVFIPPPDKLIDSLAKVQKCSDEDLEFVQTSVCDDTDITQVPRRHQQDSIAWMLRREVDGAQEYEKVDLPAHSVTILASTTNNRQGGGGGGNSAPAATAVGAAAYALYYHPLTCQTFVVLQPPQLSEADATALDAYANPVVHGGILADEMGLGKTLCLMSLMVLNPLRGEVAKTQVAPPWNLPHALYPPLKDSTHPLSGLAPKPAGLKMTLAAKKKAAKEALDRPLVNARLSIKATLVILPVSLVGQWESEIRTVSPGSKIVVFHGLNKLKTKKQREELLNADVVLTTYETMKHHVGPEDHKKDASKKELSKMCLTWGKTKKQQQEQVKWIARFLQTWPVPSRDEASRVCKQLGVSFGQLWDAATKAQDIIGSPPAEDEDEDEESSSSEESSSDDDDDSDDAPPPPATVGRGRPVKRKGEQPLSVAAQFFQTLNFHRIIFDESQKYNSHFSDFAGLRATSTWFVSGTPIKKEFYGELTEKLDVLGVTPYHSTGRVGRAGTNTYIVALRDYPRNNDCWDLNEKVFDLTETHKNFFTKVLGLVKDETGNVLDDDDVVGEEWAAAFKTKDGSPARCLRNHLHKFMCHNVKEKATLALLTNVSHLLNYLELNDASDETVAYLQKPAGHSLLETFHAFWAFMFGSLLGFSPPAAPSVLQSSKGGAGRKNERVSFGLSGQDKALIADYCNMAEFRPVLTSALRHQQNLALNAREELKAEEPFQAEIQSDVDAALSRRQTLLEDLDQSSKDQLRATSALDGHSREADEYQIKIATLQATIEGITSGRLACPVTEDFGELKRETSELEANCAAAQAELQSHTATIDICHANMKRCVEERDGADEKTTVLEEEIRQLRAQHQPLLEAAEQLHSLQSSLQKAQDDVFEASHAHRWMYGEKDLTHLGLLTIGGEPSSRSIEKNTSVVMKALGRVCELCAPQRGVNVAALAVGARYATLRTLIAPDIATRQGLKKIHNGHVLSIDQLAEPNPHHISPNTLRLIRQHSQDKKYACAVERGSDLMQECPLPGPPRVDLAKYFFGDFVIVNSDRLARELSDMFKIKVVSTMSETSAPRLFNGQRQAPPADGTIPGALAWLADFAKNWSDIHGRSNRLQAAKQVWLREIPHVDKDNIEALEAAKVKCDEVREKISEREIELVELKQVSAATRQKRLSEMRTEMCRSAFTLGEALRGKEVAQETLRHCEDTLTTLRPALRSAEADHAPKFKAAQDARAAELLALQEERERLLNLVAADEQSLTQANSEEEVLTRQKTSLSFEISNLEISLGERMAVTDPIQARIKASETLSRDIEKALKGDTRALVRLKLKRKAELIDGVFAPCNDEDQIQAGRVYWFLHNRAYWPVVASTSTSSGSGSGGTNKKKDGGTATVSVKFLAGAEETVSAKVSSLSAFSWEDEGDDCEDLINKFKTKNGKIQQAIKAVHEEGVLPRGQRQDPRELGEAGVRALFDRGTRPVVCKVPTVLQEAAAWLWNSLSGTLPDTSEQAEKREMKMTFSEDFDMDDEDEKRVAMDDIPRCVVVGSALPTQGSQRPPWYYPEQILDRHMIRHVKAHATVARDIALPERTVKIVRYDMVGDELRLYRELEGDVITQVKALMKRERLTSRICKLMQWVALLRRFVVHHSLCPADRAPIIGDTADAVLDDPESDALKVVPMKAQDLLKELLERKQNSAAAGAGGGGSSSKTRGSNNKTISENFLDDLRGLCRDPPEVAECDVCSEPLSKPVMLSCFHAFCRECILSIRQDAARRKHLAKCPKCEAPNLEEKKVQIGFDAAAAAANSEETSSVLERAAKLGDNMSKFKALLEVFQGVWSSKSDGDGPDAKIVVFSNEGAVMQKLRRFLESHRVQAEVIDGSTTLKKRSLIIQRFQDSRSPLKVCLLTARCGNAGLTLTAAHHLVLMEPSLRVAMEQQAMGRVHRFGQTKPVTIHRLVANGTVEERTLAVTGGDSDEGPQINQSSGLNELKRVLGLE